MFFSFFGVPKDNCHTRNDIYEYSEKMQFRKGHASYGDINKAKKKGTRKYDIIIKIQDISTFPKEEVFWTEAWLFNRVSKKTNVVPKFLDVWICGDKGYIAMENWLPDNISEGGSFKEFEKIFEKMTAEQQIKITLKLLEMYKELHEEGKILHSDVREPNLLFRKKDSGNYEFIIIDFGLSEDLHKTKDERVLIQEYFYDYLRLLDMLELMGAKFLKTVNFLYRGNKYCVLSSEIESPEINQFFSRQIQKYVPDSNVFEFFKQELNHFNASEIRADAIRKGKCAELPKGKRKKPLEEDFRRRKVWKNIQKILTPGGLAPVPLPKQ